MHFNYSPFFLQHFFLLWLKASNCIYYFVLLNWLWVCVSFSIPAVRFTKSFCTHFFFFFYFYLYWYALQSALNTDTHTPTNRRDFIAKIMFYLSVDMMNGLGRGAGRPVMAWQLFTHLRVCIYDDNADGTLTSIESRVSFFGFFALGFVVLFVCAAL